VKLSFAKYSPPKLSKTIISHPAPPATPRFVTTFSADDGEAVGAVVGAEGLGEADRQVVLGGAERNSLNIRADATVSIVTPCLNMDENDTNLSKPLPSSR
jgi:hypothetical protein